MKRIKMILMAMVAVLAIGAVGASAASAGSGSGAISTSEGDCNFTFNTSGWEADGDGWGTDATGITKGTPCEVDSISGSAYVHKKADGTATIDADFTIKGLGGLITCRYTASASGTWTYTNPPANTIKAFVFNGPVNATKVSGSFLCPNPVTVNSLTMTINP